MSSVLDTLNLRFTSDLQVERCFHEQKIAGEICLVKVSNFITFRLSSTPEVYDILITVNINHLGRDFGRQVSEEE